MNKIELNLEKDYYTARMVGKNITFQRILLIKNDSSWKWEGALHELVSSSKPVEGALLEGVTNQYNAVEGHRSSKPDKWKRDIVLLEEELKKDPDNGRYQFYLAQSYLIDGQTEKALLEFQKRTEMRGNTLFATEEVFWSLYTIGCLQSDLKKPDDLVIDSFLRAFAFDETRAEPLFRLAVHFQLMGSPILSYLTIQRALKIPKPTAALQIQHAVYDYLLTLKRAEMAWLIGKAEESFDQYKKLLESPNLPQATRDMVLKNVETLSGIFA